MLGGLGNTALNRTANVAVGRGAGQLARVMGSMSPETAQALGTNETSKLTASLLSNQGQSTNTLATIITSRHIWNTAECPQLQHRMPQGPQPAISPESPLSRLATGGQICPQPPQSPMDENTMATGRAINDKEQELTTQQVKDAQQTTFRLLMTRSETRFSGIGLPGKIHSKGISIPFTPRSTTRQTVLIRRMQILRV